MIAVNVWLRTRRLLLCGSSGVYRSRQHRGGLSRLSPVSGLAYTAPYECCSVAVAPRLAGCMDGPFAAGAKHWRRCLRRPGAAPLRRLLQAPRRSRGAGLLGRTRRQRGRKLVEQHRRCLCPVGGVCRALRPSLGSRTHQQPVPAIVQPEMPTRADWGLPGSAQWHEYLRAQSWTTPLEPCCHRAGYRQRRDQPGCHRAAEQAGGRGVFFGARARSESALS